MIYVSAETNLNIVCYREVTLAMLPEWRSPLSTNWRTSDPTSLVLTFSIMLPNKRSRPSLSFSLLWMTCQSWRRPASKYFYSPSQHCCTCLKIFLSCPILDLSLILQLSYLDNLASHHPSLKWSLLICYEGAWESRRAQTHCSYKVSLEINC